MKLKKGDKVVVISGKDRGKTGTISSVDSVLNRVVVDGVNVAKKHKKVRGGKGQIVEKPMAIHASNVMFVDPKDNKGTRLSVVRKDDGSRVRVTKNSNQEV